MFELSTAVELEGNGAVLVARHAPVGMVTLKAGLNRAISAALKQSTGAGVPPKRKIRKGIAWMAPDELLIFTESDPDALIRELDSRITAPALLADVSDARAVFTLKGRGVRDVLAKGAPIDLSPEAFGTDDFRRTRLGQVAVALWIPAPDEARLICLASVGQFVFDWLVNASQKDSLPDYFST
ncbi:MAG: hypothetical protein L3J37_12525 [Rhodobacteraceae bacterium]|nr:hypothetical protein [Paracoccaceae bacterium]